MGQVVTATIAVLETASRWTPELQRQLSGEAVVVRQCTAADVLQLTTKREPLVVVLPLDSQEAQVMQLLASIAQARAATIVIGSMLTEELEAPVRELGASLFLANRPTGAALAKACRRQLGEQ